MSQPVVTLRGDLTGTAFGGTPTWTDYTAYLETAADGMPVDITWGRQDNRADVPTGQLMFMLNNSTGLFTTGAAVIECDHLFNLQLASGDRFTGYVTSVEPTWPGGVQSWSVVKVTCMDVTGKLATGQPLRSLVEQEMLADNPDWLYPLGEETGSGAAGDISGNTAPSLIPTASKYGAGTLEFGTEMPGLVDEGTGVLFNSAVPGIANDAAMSVLRIQHQATDTLVPTGGGFTWECWFVYNEAPVLNSVIVGQFGGGQTVGFYMRDTGDVYFRFGSASSYELSPISPVLAPGVAHHLVATVPATLDSIGLICDGVDLGTYPMAGVTISGDGARTTVVGGLLMSTQSIYSLSGTVALIAQYPTVLSAARAIDHYKAGVGTLIESSDDRFARFASYAGVTTSGLPTGEATMGHQNTAGRTVLDALTEVARTEGSAVYATGDGAVTFQARSRRYNLSPSWYATGDDIAPETPVRKDMQDFFNELTVDRVGGATMRVVDAVSQAGKAGRVDGGSFTVASSTDEEARQNAAWQVALHSPETSRTRYPALQVDLLSWTSGYVDTYEALYGGDPEAEVLGLGVSDLIALSGLPSQAPIAEPELIVEGGHEVIGARTWTVEFFTSPNLPPVWTLDDATLGELDADNVLAF